MKFLASKLFTSVTESFVMSKKEVKEVKETKKSVSIFSLWRCCLSGETNRPKVQKKSVAKDQPDAPIEKGKEALEDKGKVVDKTSDLELEYVATPPESAPAVSPSDDYRPSYEEANTASTAPSTVGSEEDSTLNAPASIQVMQENGTPSKITREVGTGGRLNLQFVYDPAPSKLTLTLLGVEFPPFQKWKMDDLEVSCTLLPIHQHSFRARPKKFKDPFTMTLTPKEKIKTMSLRFRLYNHRAMSKHLIGQGVVSLGEINLTPQAVKIALDLNIPETYAIDSRYIESVTGANGQTSSEDSKPEILLSLEYRSLTRKLIAEVIKTRHLGLLNNSKPQDLAVEMKLIGDNNQVLRVCRTSLKKHVIDAEFNEMFMFRVTHDKLSSIAVVFTLFRMTERRGKRENIGEVCFGKQSSSHEQQNHWNQVVTGSERVVTQWHPLFK